MLYLDAKSLEKSLAFPILIETLKAAFCKDYEIPTRSIHPLAGGGSLLLMPAWRNGAYPGVKTVTVFPSNGEKFEKPAVHATYTLFDANSGEPSHIWTAAL